MTTRAVASLVGLTALGAAGAAQAEVRQTAAIGYLSVGSPDRCGYCADGSTAGFEYALAVPLGGARALRLGGWLYGARETRARIALVELEQASGPVAARLGLGTGQLTVHNSDGGTGGGRVILGTIAGALRTTSHPAVATEVAVRIGLAYFGDGGDSGTGVQATVTYGVVW